MTDGEHSQRPEPPLPEIIGQGSTKTAKVRQIAISAFIMFHLLAIVCWCVPMNSPLLDVCRQLIRPYMLWSGLFQSWDTFAPQPKLENDYIQAAVITHDGHTNIWTFPQMEQLSFLQRYSKERYRKFSEAARETKNAALWPDVARHLARLYRSPGNPPEIVILIRYWSGIPPPVGPSERGGPQRANILIEYSLTPEDLR